MIEVCRGRNSLFYIIILLYNNPTYCYSVGTAMWLLNFITDDWQRRLTSHACETLRNKIELLHIRLPKAIKQTFLQSAHKWHRSNRDEPGKLHLTCVPGYFRYLLRRLQLAGSDFYKMLSFSCNEYPISAVVSPELMSMFIK